MVNKSESFNFAVDEHTKNEFQFLMDKMETDVKVDVFEAIVSVVAQIVRTRGIGFIFKYLIAKSKKGESLLD